MSTPPLSGDGAHLLEDPLAFIQHLLVVHLLRPGLGAGATVVGVPGGWLRGLDLTRGEWGRSC